MAPRSDCPLRKGKLSKVKPRRHSKYLSEALYSAGLSLPQGRCLVTAKPQGGTCPKATPESVAVGGATATVACFPRCPNGCRVKRIARVSLAIANTPNGTLLPYF